MYVDEAKNKKGRYLMCHMMADTLEELHAMADLIGHKREWFQDGKYPHYDVCKSRRDLALKAGAIEVSSRDLVKMFNVTKEKQDGKIE